MRNNVIRNQQRRAIVIGGGVIGCTTAYYLAKHGWHVRVLEANRVGRGCSHGNCGFICPSHVLPLTIPGAIRRILKQMLSKDSPVYVKPRLDPALWAWLTQFALHCRQSKMMETSRARHALLASSMELYRQLLAEESLDVEWQDRGLLLVFKSPHEFEAYEKIAQLVQREFGIVAATIDGEQLVDIEPALRPGMAGGWHYQGDAHLRPDKLFTSLGLLLGSLNVEILDGVTVNRIDIQRGQAKSLETSQGSMAADLVIVAAGAETPRFAKQLGCRIPIQPGKGYSITMPRPNRSPAIPMIFEEYHVAVTPWPSGIRIGSTMEFVGYDRTINRRRLELFKRAAAEYLLEPPQAMIREEWWGWRPMTYDELPCIGPVPKANNVIVAAGHGMIGMASATASGKLAAELASGVEPHLDPAPYALTRFGG